LDIDPLWTGSVAIVASGLLHGVHVSPGARAQNVMVAVKVVMIVALIAIGTVVILGRETPLPDGEFDGGTPEFVEAFAFTMMWIWFAYSGWNAAVYVAGEVRDPERSLPRALIGGTLLVTAAYLALNWVFVRSAPIADLRGQAEIGAIAADAIGGSWLRIAVGGLVSLALVTSITSMVMAGPRVYARMAADGVFPRVFREGEGPPRAAIALQCVLALVILWNSALEEKLTYVGWTLGVSTAAAVVGLFLVRRREGPGAVPVIGWPILPAFYVIAVLGTAALAFRYALTQDSLAPAWAVGTLGIGALLYPLARRAGAAR
jgi:APA family basic amino acid/polyamine antiporter